MRLILALIQPTKLRAVQEALAKIGVDRMTVCDAQGYGRQKGQAATYRGAEYKRAVRDGVVYGFDVPIKQRGTMQFRVAVRDVPSSRIGAAGQLVEVPNLEKGDLAISGIFLRGLPAEQKTTVAANQAPPADDGELITSGPGVRRFRQGSSLVLGYAIYNATNKRPAALTTQMRLFRDGKPVLVGAAVPINLEGQTDPRRIVSASGLQLDSKMEPGEYIVQIIVTESSNKKPRAASQWVDFEVIK